MPENEFFSQLGPGDRYYRFIVHPDPNGGKAKTEVILVREGKVELPFKRRPLRRPEPPKPRN